MLNIIRDIELLERFEAREGEFEEFDHVRRYGDEYEEMDDLVNEAKFRLGLTERAVYHGGCLDCNSQLFHGLNRCNSCQYRNAEWDKVDLNLKDKPTQEIKKSRVELRSRTLNIQNKRQKEKEMPWDNMAEKLAELSKTNMMPKAVIETVMANTVVDKPLSELYTLPEYLSKLVAPFGQQNHKATPEVLQKIIAEGIESYNGSIAEVKEKDFCKVKD